MIYETPDERSSLEFIEKNNLILAGSNPDPRGLGGSGGTKYQYVVSNTPEDSQRIFKGKGHTLGLAVVDFQNEVRKRLESIQSEYTSQIAFLSRMSGKE